MKSIFISIDLIISLAHYVTAKDTHKPSEVISLYTAINPVVPAQNGAPFYSVNRNNQALLADTKLWFEFKDLTALSLSTDEDQPFDFRN